MYSDFSLSRADSRTWTGQASTDPDTVIDTRRPGTAGRSSAPPTTALSQCRRVLDAGLARRKKLQRCSGSVGSWE
ncbi:hypothetical protein LA76x_5065 [Lysobacter antibioticus]|uniref:Uncharacterized protein n=1 Tax=Lysobacter antibioticus TaxID=84531 RepID=A0A0S2FHZ6_LYSAN|nr:hypothetical protein LA76x_5065 [Lysobacter antibioticus]